MGEYHLPGHIFFGGSTAEVAFVGGALSLSPSKPLFDMGSSFSENMGSLISAGAFDMLILVLKRSELK